MIRVSGAIAIRRWLCSMSCSIVVPERGQPRMMIGRSLKRVLAAVGLDQDLGDLGTRELLRWELARRKQLAHLGAREEDVIVASVRAGLRRRHLAADLAPERVLEEHRLDVELVRLELVEDELGVVGAVVAADSRVVSADDEVRAAVVLAADRMPDRLAGARVAHRGRERGDDHPLGGVVAVDERVVGPHAYVGRNEIGRASCRERVSLWGVAVAIEKK